MGQPPVWRPYASGFGVESERSRAGLGASLGVDRAVLNPVTGMLDVVAELYGEGRANNSAAGARVLARVPVFGFGVGADWRATSGDLDAVLSFQAAVRRGGVLGGGSMLRVDWIPARNQTFELGVQVPLMQPFAGRTRPRPTSVELPSSSARSEAVASVASSDTIERSLKTLADAAALIRAFTNLYSEDNERTLIAAQSRRPYGRSYDAATQAYRQALSSAFAAATGSAERGEMMAVRARAGVLDDVILPYDALFGQVKDDRGIDGMLGVAREHFNRWLSDSSGVGPASRTRALAVHERWLGVLNDVCRQLLGQWKDSRLVWLPPQLALAPEQYDEQAEVDALIARVTGLPFTDRNAVAYLRTVDLPPEIARSIAAARVYHVLWTHDFTGRRPAGELDESSYTTVADAYLPALTAAVQRYDSTGTMPQFMILLDAFYYHARDGRLWMDVLENPLHATVHLRANETTQAEHVQRRLDALRAAVSHSARLQREASEHGGDAWLAQVVKVHVSITLPSDFSFRSSRIVPPFPFVSDNIIRDHRKLVLYDFTEADPYAGELLVTGIGIGEHYASATWEDRGYRVRGPAALEARSAVRRMLEGNGVHGDRIPAPLRETKGATAARYDTSDFVVRALHVHNDPGFATKRSSVARAMLYSLAPPGSVIIVPDPLWVSASWAAMLAAAAARGSQVMVIAPALANAPSPEVPIIVLERDVLRRLLRIRDHLDAQLRQAHGALRIGIFAARAPVTDVAGRVAEVRDGLTRAPWIRDVIPFDAQALAVLDRATAQAGQAQAEAPAIAHDEKPREPQLHQKTVFIARPGAIAALVHQPGWEDALGQAIRAQSRETTRLAERNGSVQRADGAPPRVADSLLQRYEHSLSEAERKQISFYFSLGTQNHDPRGLMLDGEATVIVSGFQASAGLVDLFYLMARTTWIEREADIDRLVPAPRGLLTRVAQLIRFAM
jgi:phosphatidylserine/phosphatidylglycerophosphate/cardiolipin synthase-like enzyme